MALNRSDDGNFNPAADSDANFAALIKLVHYAAKWCILNLWLL
jgi:hypothetical protein